MFNSVRFRLTGWYARRAVAGDDCLQHGRVFNGGANDS